MSHVDDGTLHAYLDGELAPMERGRIEEHLTGCSPCRERLAEARALITRADQLLALAAPAAPTRTAPPFHRLRPRPAWWHVRMPLAWAATLTLALGTGWFLRGRTMSPPETPVLDRPTVAQAPIPANVVVAVAPPEQATPVALQRPPASASAAETETTNNGAVAPPSSAVAAKAAARLSADQAAPLRGEVGRVSGEVVTTVPPAPLALDEAPRTDRARLSTTWTVIASSSARDLLGTDPATIPGQPIRALRRGPGPAPEILVEQELGGGVVVLLYEQVVDQGATVARRELVARGGAVPPGNERLARFIGSLRVEIAGPLPADSLSRLLDSVR